MATATLPVLALVLALALQVVAYGPLPTVRRRQTRQVRVVRALWGNKYSEFSKRERDPLEVALEEARVKEASARREERLRGTTVPIQVDAHVHMDAGTGMRKGKAKAKAKAADGSSSSSSYASVASAGSKSGKLSLSSPIHRTAESIVPTDAFTFGYMEIGKVLGPHGIKGEVKIKFESDFTQARVAAGETLFVKRPNRRTPRPITVAEGRPATDGVYLIKFTGIASRSMARALRDFSVYTRAEARPELGSDEYLIRDLVGAEVWNLDAAENEDALVGTVEGVVPPDELCSPSVAQFMHAMLEVRVYASKNKELVLIPLVPAIVSSVERGGAGMGVDEGAIARVNIHPPSGLLDLTYTETVRVSLRGFLPACATISDDGRTQLFRYREDERREKTRNK